MIDPHRETLILEHFAAWGRAKPQVPASSKDWSPANAAAVAKHIRSFDEMMHRLALCPPKGGWRKGARDLCCSICMDTEHARKARAKP